MDKAFSLSDLGKRLLAKAKLIAVPATEAVLDWTAESCSMVESPIVKGIGGVLVAVKPTVLAEVAKAVV